MASKETVHGSPIIAQGPETPKQPGTLASRVILVRLDEGPYQPFVTAMQCRSEKTGSWQNEWCWGHYFRDEDEAKKDFAHRVERGF